MTITSIQLQTGAESAPALAGIDILPLEAGGRSPLSPIGANGGAVIPVGDASLVQLPGPGAVRVVHYRASNPTRFGFFSIHGAGEVRLLIEQPGVGPGGALNAFDPIVAVAADGLTVAVSAAHYSGGIGGLGNTWLLRAGGDPFPGGAVAVEITGSGEQDVPASSLAFLGGFLYADFDGRVGRAPIDGSAKFVAIPWPGGFPAEVVEEFAVSADASKLIVLAGANEQQVDMFAIDGAGVVSQLTHVAADIQPPGYLPADPTGPHLTLSSNGDIVAYEIEFAAGHELYLQHTTAGSAPAQVTPDVLFEHSIDNVSGILIAASFARFFADSGLNNADLYQADLGAGGTLTVGNLTATSGATTPMFPNLATINVGLSRALGDARLFVDQTSAVTRDLWFVTAAGQSQVATNLTQNPLVAFAAGSTTDAFVTAPGSAGTSLLRFADGQIGSPLAPLPPGVTVREIAIDQGATRLALIADVGADSVVLTWNGNTHIPVLAGGQTYRGARNLLFGLKGQVLFTAQTGANATSYSVALNGALTKVATTASEALWLR